MASRPRGPDRPRRQPLPGAALGSVQVPSRGSPVRPGTFGDVVRGTGGHPRRGPVRRTRCPACRRRYDLSRQKAAPAQVISFPLPIPAEPAALAAADPESAAPLLRASSPDGLADLFLTAGVTASTGWRYRWRLGSRAGGRRGALPDGRRRSAGTAHPVADDGTRMPSSVVELRGYVRGDWEATVPVPPDRIRWWAPDVVTASVHAAVHCCHRTRLEASAPCRNSGHRSARAPWRPRGRRVGVTTVGWRWLRRRAPDPGNAQSALTELSDALADAALRRAAPVRRAHRVKAVPAAVVALLPGRGPGSAWLAAQRWA